MINHQPDIAKRIQRIEHNLKPSDTFRNLFTRRHSIEESMTRYNVPGLSVAVINDGQLEWAKGYGVREAGNAGPVTIETLFQCASISKPVAAIGAMRLVEMGKLALDEDVNERLTSWKVPPTVFKNGAGYLEYWQPRITLRQLVSHTAGLTVHGFPGYTSDQRIPSLTDILDGKLPANTPAIYVDTLPGLQYRYSGGGYCVLLQLLEDVTGKPFPTLLRELVLDPFGMSHSTYDQPLPEAYAVYAASAHRSGAKMIPGKYHIYPEIAAAGLWTTPSDLAQFVLTLQRAFTGKDNTLLSQQMMQQIFTPQAPASMGATIGLGLFLYGKGETARFGHDGGNEGFLSRLLAYQQRGQGAIVMGNSDECWPVLQEMLDAIAEEYQWPDYAPAKPTPIEVNPAQLDAHVGTYRAKMGQEFYVTRQDDSLYLTYNYHAQQPPIQLFPLSSTHFYMEAVNAEVTFARDRTNHLKFKQNGQEIVAKRTMVATLSLPHGFTVRTPTYDDLDEIAGIFIAREIADTGKSESSIATSSNWIRSVWESDGMQLDKDGFVVIAPDGHCAGYVTVWHPNETPDVLFASPRIHPNYQGMGIGTYLLMLAEKRSREYISVTELSSEFPATLNSWVDAPNKAAQAILEREGFIPTRYYWRLEIEMSEAPPQPVLPGGVIIRRFVKDQDDYATYATVDESFEDSWDYTPQTFEEWTHWETQSASFDPTYWFLAVHDGEVIGTSLSRHDVGETASIGWISDLAVRPAWRKQGIGFALLQHTLGAFYRDGIRKAGLSVDSENRSSAFRLYEHAGMHRVERHEVRYQKVLRQGH